MSKVKIEKHYRGKVIYHLDSKDRFHRNNGPAVITFFNGKVISKEYFCHGKVSVNEYGQSKVCYYHNDELKSYTLLSGKKRIYVLFDEYQKLNEISYYEDKKLNRKNGPADILFFSNGMIEYMEYYNEGKYHREDGPAIVAFFENGNLDFKEYFINGKQHRESGPAHVRYHNCGVIGREYYMINGIKHRENGPAAIRYDERGNKVFEEYYNEGKVHREDGPATIFYGINGKPINSNYSINGQPCNDIQLMVIKAKEKQEKEDKTILSKIINYIKIHTNKRCSQ